MDPWRCRAVGRLRWQSKGILKHGVKKKLQQRDPAQTGDAWSIWTRSSKRVHSHPCMDAWDGDYRALLDWWRRLVTADVRGRVQFPADVAAAHGPHALAGSRPRWSSGPSTPSRVAKPTWSIFSRISARPVTPNTTGAARRAIP